MQMQQTATKPQSIDFTKSQRVKHLTMPLIGDGNESIQMSLQSTPSSMSCWSSQRVSVVDNMTFTHKQKINKKFNMTKTHKRGLSKKVNSNEL